MNATNLKGMSKTNYYRRLRKAKELGCSIDEIPDNRGKHKNHARSLNQHKWNSKRLFDQNGYPLIRAGLNHPLADSNGYCREHIMIWCSAGNQRPEKGFVIHHLNRNLQDNRIENLKMMSISEHNKLNNQLLGRDDNGRLVKRTSFVKWLMSLYLRFINLENKG